MKSKTVKIQSLDGEKVEKHKATSIVPCFNANFANMYTVILENGNHYPISEHRLIDDGGLLNEEA